MIMDGNWSPPVAAFNLVGSIEDAIAKEKMLLRVDKSLLCFPVVQFDIENWQLLIYLLKELHYDFSEKRSPNE